MWGRTAKGVVGMLAVAALAGTGLVSTSGADEAEEAQAAGLDTYYLVDVTGHPHEPYAELPEEVPAGYPSTYIELQQDPLPIRCEVISGVYDPSTVVDAVAYMLSQEKYQNPTKAWAVNPPDSRPSKAQKATFPNGPQADAECMTTTSGKGSATFGRYLSENFSIDFGSSESTNQLLPGQDTIVSESTNKLFGFKAGPLSIDSIASWLKVISKANEVPSVEYRIELHGIRNGKDVGGAFGSQGLVIAGQGVAGEDMVQQFNTQVNSQRKAFETLGQYGFEIVRPQFGVATTGRYVFEVSAMDSVIGAAARREELGHGFGYRLGVSRVATKYGVYGEPAPTTGYDDEVEDPRIGV